MCDSGLPSPPSPHPRQEYHRFREAEHRSRERYGRRFRPFPWSEAVVAVLADEALEDDASVVALIKELGRQGRCRVGQGEVQAASGPSC